MLVYSIMVYCHNHLTFGANIICALPISVLIRVQNSAISVPFYN